MGMGIGHSSCPRGWGLGGNSWMSWKVTNSRAPISYLQNPDGKRLWLAQEAPCQKKEDRKWNSGWFSENFCCSGTSGLSKLKQLPRISATVLEIPVPWRGLELFLRIQGFGRGGSHQGQSRGELRAEQCFSPESFIPVILGSDCWDFPSGCFPSSGHSCASPKPCHGYSCRSCSWKQPTVLLLLEK